MNTVIQKADISNIGIKYWIYQPKQNDEDKLPVLFYFHGAGERGEKPEKVLRHGPPKLIEEGKEFPFLVISPQCPANTYWRKINLIAFIDEMISGFPIDRERIYLSGNSMGGYCTWFLAIAFPYMFAAIAPVCGGGDSTQVFKIKHLPVWAFHGEDDDVVPYSESLKMVQQLRDVGGDIKFTTYQDTGHDSWTITYANDELYEWMMKQKRT